MSNGRAAMSGALLEAVRGLRAAHPELGAKPLLAKLREQHPHLEAGAREVREALDALKAEVKDAADSPAAAEAGGAPPNAALRLVCITCSEDVLQQHVQPPTDMEVDSDSPEELPRTYFCSPTEYTRPGPSTQHTQEDRGKRRLPPPKWWSEVGEHIETQHAQDRSSECADEELIQWAFTEGAEQATPQPHSTKFKMQKRSGGATGAAGDETSEAPPAPISLSLRLTLALTLTLTLLTLTLTLTITLTLLPPTLSCPYKPKPNPNPNPNPDPTPSRNPNRTLAL